MYQGNWDQMLKELDDLHADVFKGRLIDYRFNNATVQLQSALVSSLKNLLNRSLYELLYIRFVLLSRKE